MTWIVLFFTKIKRVCLFVCSKEGPAERQARLLGCVAAGGEALHWRRWYNHQCSWNATHQVHCFIIPCLMCFILQPVWVATFKHHLKTILFTEAYSVSPWHYLSLIRNFCFTAIFTLFSATVHFVSGALQILIVIVIVIELHVALRLLVPVCLNRQQLHNNDPCLEGDHFSWFDVDCLDRLISEMSSCVSRWMLSSVHVTRSLLMERLPASRTIWSSPWRPLADSAFSVINIEN